MTPSRPKKLTVTIQEDGSVKIDASQMPGTSEEILAELGDLAEMLSGDPASLVVEKHVHSHGHTHTDTHVRQH